MKVSPTPLALIWSSVPKLRQFARYIGGTLLGRNQQYSANHSDSMLLIYCSNLLDVVVVISILAIVIPVVVGSNPIIHPSQKTSRVLVFHWKHKSALSEPLWFLFTKCTFMLPFFVTALPVVASARVSDPVGECNSRIEPIFVFKHILL